MNCLLSKKGPNFLNDKKALVTSVLRDDFDYEAYKINLSKRYNVSDSAGDGCLGKLKSYFKSFGRLYEIFTRILGVLPTRAYFRERNRFLAPGPNEIVVNLGSGPSYIKKERVLNADIFPFENVDLICDAHELPIKDNSIDKFIALGMLEHVKAPSMVIHEMFRTLKPGGEVLCCIPFMQPYHAAPHDYSRWTQTGLEELFKEYSNVRILIGVGPTSALVWFFQEWFSTLFSFGSKYLKDFYLILLMIILAPVKLIDIFMSYLPGSKAIASAFLIIAKK